MLLNKLLFFLNNNFVIVIFCISIQIANNLKFDILFISERGDPFDMTDSK